MSKTQKKEKTRDIKGKQELLLVSLNHFYENEYNKMALMDILEGKNKISLRIIDMNINTKKKKDLDINKKGSGKSSKKQRKKRAPLSVAATRNMNVNKSPITLNFD